jgi:hypothetical protein
MRAEHLSLAAGSLVLLVAFETHQGRMLILGGAILVLTVAIDIVRHRHRR